MKYPTLDFGSAFQALEQASAVTDETAAWRGTGATLDIAVIDSLCAKLAQLRKTHREAAFDAEASVLVHSLLPRDPEMCCDVDFWTWLATTRLPDIIRWRFPGKVAQGDSPPKTNLANFGAKPGVRQRQECYPYKLWIRADISIVADGQDPYRFTRRGDVDFWTSHILRQGFTVYRPVALALIRYQYPDEKKGAPLLHSGEEDPAASVFGIRTLAKLLKRLQANYDFSSLDDGSAEKLIQWQAQRFTQVGRK